MYGDGFFYDPNGKMQGSTPVHMNPWDSVPGIGKLPSSMRWVDPKVNYWKPYSDAAFIQAKNAYAKEPVKSAERWRQITTKYLDQASTAYHAAMGTTKPDAMTKEGMKQAKVFNKQQKKYFEKQKKKSKMGQKKKKHHGHSVESLLSALVGNSSGPLPAFVAPI